MTYTFITPSFLSLDIIIMLRYFYWLLAIAFVLSFYVWQQTQAVRMGYKVGQLKTECEKWEQGNKDIRLKIGRLISMERLDNIAKERKLITPGEKSVIYLRTAND